MVYSFARAGAGLAMHVDDYFQKNKRWWFRLHEKGNNYHEMPLHHKAEEYWDACIEAVGIAGEKKQPLFRALNQQSELSTNRLTRRDHSGSRNFRSKR
jgi:hypothetical protein